MFEPLATYKRSMCGRCGATFGHPDDVAFHICSRRDDRRPTIPNDVVDAITNERDFQDRKHGPLSGAGAHTLGEWLLLIEAELHEAKVALIKGGEGRNSLRSELVQVAALVFAALEQHGLNDPHSGRQI